MTSDEKIAQLAAAVDEETKARPGAPQTHPEFDRLIRTIWRPTRRLRLLLRTLPSTLRKSLATCLNR